MPQNLKAAACDEFSYASEGPDSHPDVRIERSAARCRRERDSTRGRKPAHLSGVLWTAPCIRLGYFKWSLHHAGDDAFFIVDHSGVSHGSGIRSSASAGANRMIGSPAACSRGRDARRSREVGRLCSHVGAATTSPGGGGVKPRTFAALGARAHDRAWRADEKVHRRAHQPNGSKLVACPRRRVEVERGFTCRWSPPPITARCPVTGKAM